MVRVLNGTISLVNFPNYLNIYESNSKISPLSLLFWREEGSLIILIIFAASCLPLSVFHLPFFAKCCGDPADCRFLNSRPQRVNVEVHEGVASHSTVR